MTDKKKRNPLEYESPSFYEAALYQEPVEPKRKPQHEPEVLEAKLRKGQ